MQTPPKKTLANTLISPKTFVSPYTAWKLVNFNPGFSGCTQIVEWKNPDSFTLQLFKDYREANESKEVLLENLFPYLFSKSITQYE